MPSPFPGMNPYLENPDDFHTFHEAFIVKIVTALSPSLNAAGYFAKDPPTSVDP